jgi:starch-binding outer membrane protein SusE/F
MKSIYQFFNKVNGWQNVSVIMLLTVLFATSCKKEIGTEFNKGDVPLALTVNSDTLQLNQKAESADALILNWTTGSNKGTNAAISYTLKIDKQGNNFSNALVEDLGKNTLTKKYTVKQLNDLLLTHWNFSPGAEAKLEVKVITAVAGKETLADSTSPMMIVVTPYKPVTSTLYLIGDAAPNGWSADNATPMTAAVGQPGKFAWTGLLKKGEMKFITTLGQFLPSYNKGANENTLVFRTADTEPDNKFIITTTGTYNVSVSLLDGTISIEESTAPPYNKLWIVGEATPNGWNIDNPNQMRQDESNPFVFTYNEVLKAGEFKIPTSTGNWGTDYYMPPTNHPPLTSTAVQLVAGGNPDNKWQIANAGAYKIKLDLLSMSINIHPFTPYTNIWMVGDATPNGWNIDNPVQMTPTAGNPYEFTYTGPMSAGEFKLPLAKGNWATDYFMPVIDQSGTSGTQMKFVKSGSPDHKWRLTEAGNYKIIIDQLRETISIQKL